MSEQTDLVVHPEAAPPVPIAGAKLRSEMISVSDTGVSLTNMADMVVFAKAVVDSGLAPKDCRSWQDCLIRLQMAMEVGLPPMQGLNSIAVINGRPSIYGDAGKALLRSRGFDIEEKDTADIAKDGFAKCTITRSDRKPVTRTFSIEDAKKAGLFGKSGPWAQYPNRQMAWRAFWFAARDAAPDVLRGIGGGEEAEDTPKNVTRSLDELETVKAVAT